MKSREELFFKYATQQLETRVHVPGSRTCGDLGDRICGDGGAGYPHTRQFFGDAGLRQLEGYGVVGGQVGGGG